MVNATVVMFGLNFSRLRKKNGCSAGTREYQEADTPQANISVCCHT